MQPSELSVFVQDCLVAVKDMRAAETRLRVERPGDGLGTDYFNRTLPDPNDDPDYYRDAYSRLKEIGGAIFAKHGINGMRDVCDAAGNMDSDAGSCLEASWDGVGEWRF